MIHPYCKLSWPGHFGTILLREATTQLNRVLKMFAPLNLAGFYRADVFVSAHPLDYDPGYNGHVQQLIALYCRMIASSPRGHKI